jgi:hypothetical protein
VSKVPKGSVTSPSGRGILRGVSASIVPRIGCAVWRLRVGLASPIVAAKPGGPLIGFCPVLLAMDRDSFYNSSSGRGRGFAVSRMYLRADWGPLVGRARPERSSMSLRLRAGRNFIVGPDPPPFPLPLSCGPALRSLHHSDARTRRQDREGRPAPPPSMAVDPKQGMIAKIRGPISVKDYAFGARARVPSVLRSVTGRAGRP